MEPISSLSVLFRSAERQFGRPLLVPVDGEFVDAVHSSAPAEGTESGSACDFVAAYKGLVSRNNRRNCAAAGSIASAPLPGVPSVVYGYAAAAVWGSRSGEFMGPLCSPLRKVHASVLRSEPYFVTEKSDGTRVVLVSLTAASGPCWCLLSGGDDGSKRHHVQRLDDVVSLEEAREQLRGGGAEEQICLSFGTFSVRQTGEESDDAGVELFALRRHESGSSSAGEQGGGFLSAERRIGQRQMAYCFDRSMDCAYLLLEEHAVPSLHSFVVDGELMTTSENGKKRLLLGCFDVYRYFRRDDGSCRDVSFTRTPMSARFEVLKRDIIEPLRGFQQDAVEAPMLCIFAKDLFPLAKLGDCVRRLRREEGNGPGGGVRFLYDGPHGWTRSDGFIFTPEKFDIMQGSNKTQLKWKWPSMLSVDWSLTAFEGRDNIFVVDAFFRKKRFGHQPDSCGRVRLSSKMVLLNPLALPVPTKGSVVAECVFDRRQRCWSIDRLRNDKVEPNSIVTIISVMESLVENITLRALVDLVGLKDDSLSPDWLCQLEGDVNPTDHGDGECGPKALEVADEARDNTRCQLTLRATQLQKQGEHEIYLYWVVRLHTEKAPMPCVHCKVSECMGLGFACPAEDSTSRLTEHLYIALANAGGSCAWSDYTVEVAFDGRSGRWNIISLNPNGENKRSTCVGVIHHLHWLLQRGVEAAPSQQHDVSHKHTPLQEQGVETPVTPQVEQVNAHYACRTRELAAGRNRSILRHYNNWIKGVLISTSVSYLRSRSDGNKSGDDGLVVADLCSGRGGDLHKWRAHKPRMLFMTDSCLEAVAEAAARYSVSKGLSIKIVPQDKDSQGIRAHFCVLDVFDEKGSLATRLGEFLRDHNGGRSLDVVSCQFSIHYGCSTEGRIRAFLSAVSSSLRSGGVFIGTTLSDSELLRRVREYGAVFGNEIYKVHFLTDVILDDTFGVEYVVSFENSVSELPEYVVPWNCFVKLCSVYNLQLVESFGFVEYGDEHYSSPLGRELRDATMSGGRRDADGHSQLRLSPGEVEAAGLFKTFLFVKVGDQTVTEAT